MIVPIIRSTCPKHLLPNRLDIVFVAFLVKFIWRAVLRRWGQVRRLKLLPIPARYPSQPKWVTPTGNPFFSVRTSRVTIGAEIVASHCRI